MVKNPDQHAPNLAAAGHALVRRVTFTVATIEPAEDDKLTIRFTSGNDRDRVLTVPADRRFLMA
jgi:hypothetical protein